LEKIETCEKTSNDAVEEAKSSPKNETKHKMPKQNEIEHKMQTKAK
jgi:hypothetical protein